MSYDDGKTEDGTNVSTSLDEQTYRNYLFEDFEENVQPSLSIQDLGSSADDDSDLKEAIPPNGIAVNWIPPYLI